MSGWHLFRGIRGILPLSVILLWSTFGPPALADDCPDAWTTTKVKSKIFGDSGLGVFKINVDTDECVVTLNGCVKTADQRARAAKIAKGVKRVRSVRNKLTLCEAKGKESKDPDNCPDAVITSEVKSMLIAHQALKAFKINVDTDECQVVLKGCVDTKAQEKEALKLARKAEWAKSARSQLVMCDKN